MMTATATVAELTADLDVSELRGDISDLRGIQRLAGAILLQAIEDIRFRCGKTREEAMHWVQDESAEQFSFVFCCRMLDRDPEDVRRFLERRDVLQWLFAAARGDAAVPTP